MTRLYEIMEQLKAAREQGDTATEQAIRKQLREERTAAKKHYREQRKQRHCITPDAYIREHLGLMNQVQASLEELYPVIDYVEDKDALIEFIEAVRSLEARIAAILQEGES